MPQFRVTYTNTLVSKNTKICVTPNANAKMCVIPNRKPQLESVDYRLRWIPDAECHVDFMLFVLISCALVTQHKPSLQWNMGFSIHFKD